MPTVVVYTLDAVDAFGSRNSIAIDGSETIVTAGSGATVSGTGTTGDPYVVGATFSQVLQPVILQARYASKAVNTTPANITNYSSVAVQSYPSSFNLTTGQLTVPSAGWYRVSQKITLSANWSSNQYARVNFLKNGVVFSSTTSRVTGGNITLTFNGEAFTQCNANDILSISAESGQASTSSATESENEFYVLQLTGQPV